MRIQQRQCSADAVGDPRGTGGARAGTVGNPRGTAGRAGGHGGQPAGQGARGRARCGGRADGDRLKRAARPLTERLAAGAGGATRPGALGISFRPLQAAASAWTRRPRSGRCWVPVPADQVRRLLGPAGAGTRRASSPGARPAARRRRAGGQAGHRVRRPGQGVRLPGVLRARAPPGPAAAPRAPWSRRTSTAGCWRPRPRSSPAWWSGTGTAARSSPGRSSTRRSTRSAWSTPGGCPRRSSRAEVAAVRAADPGRPVLMNGFLPTSTPVALQQWWRTRDQGDSLAVAQRLADIVGIDCYPRHALASAGPLTAVPGRQPGRAAPQRGCEHVLDRAAGGRPAGDDHRGAGRALGGGHDAAQPAGRAMYSCRPRT